MPLAPIAKPLKTLPSSRTNIAELDKQSLHHQGKPRTFMRLTRALTKRRDG
jgi:hypothetical protein